MRWRFVVPGVLVIATLAAVLALVTADQAAPLRAGGLVPVPRKIKHVEPVMPDGVRIRGIARLDVTIGPDGTVRRAVIIDAHPMLSQAALDAIRQWVYEPTIRDGARVPIVLTVTLRFDPR